MSKNPVQCTFTVVADHGKPSDLAYDAVERTLLLTKAISRWDNEGGSGDGGRVLPVPADSSLDSLPLSNAELVQLQIRVIALENLLAVLLVDASDWQLALARETAECITPRQGLTPHRLTIHAAARIHGLLERSAHLRGLHPAAPSAEKWTSSRPVLEVGGAS